MLRPITDPNCTMYCVYTGIVPESLLVWARTAAAARQPTKMWCHRIHRSDPLYTREYQRTLCATEKKTHACKPGTQRTHLLIAGALCPLRRVRRDIIVCSLQLCFRLQLTRRVLLGLIAELTTWPLRGRDIYINVRQRVTCWSVPKLPFLLLQLRKLVLYPKGTHAEPRWDRRAAKVCGGLYDMHAYETHACERYACERHAYERHACERHACERHADWHHPLIACGLTLTVSSNGLPEAPERHSATASLRYLDSAGGKRWGCASISFISSLPCVCMSVYVCTEYMCACACACVRACVRVCVCVCVCACVCVCVPRRGKAERQACGGGAPAGIRTPTRCAAAEGTVLKAAVA
jgi:hypothetical protein